MKPRDYPWPVQFLIGAAFIVCLVAVALWQWATDWLFHRRGRG